MSVPAQLVRRRLAAVAASAALALALAACGDTVRFGRDEVDDPQAVVADLDARFRLDVTGETVSVTGDSRCYLAEGKDSDSIEALSYCGPVRRPGGSGDAVWDTYALSSEPAARPRRVQLSVGESAGRNVGLPAGTTLFRPDGERPPSDAAQLAAPPPAPIAPDEIRVEDGQLAAAGAPPAAGPDALVITPDLSVVLTSTLTSATADLPTGAVSAASGQEFVVATLKVAGGPALPEPNQLPFDGDPADTAAATVVVHDGKRLAVRLDDEAQDPETPTPRPRWDVSAGRAALLGNAAVRTLVVSVPIGAPVLLGVGVAGEEQTLDLRTGRRSPAVSEAYYRSNLVAPVAASYPKRTEHVGDFDADLGGYVDKAYLTSFDVRAGWAPTGRAFLVVPLQDVPDLATQSAYTYRPDFARTFALKAGSRTYPARERAGAAPSVVFDVPADFTTGTFTYRPTGRFSGGNYLRPPSGRFRASAALTIPIHF